MLGISRQNRQRDRLTGTHTHQHNEFTTSCRKKLNIQSNKERDNIFRRF